MTLSTYRDNPWIRQRVVRGENTTAIDHLFNRLDGMYPKKFREQFPDDRALNNWRAEWLESFAEEGVTLDDVASALRACRKRHDWPPSLTEFLKLCKPSQIVDAAFAESAFREAAYQLGKRDSGEDKWSHPAIYWAAVEFGSWDLRQANWSSAKHTWTKILAEKMALRDLQPVPPRALALPPPPKMSKEEAGERIAALKRELAKRNQKMSGLCES